MWILQNNAVSDEQQGSAQQLQVSFRSAGVEFVIFINKWGGFSQSLLRVVTLYVNGITVACDFQLCENRFLI